MNLSQLDSYFADREIALDLDAIYKKHITHTHQRALEAVFLAGFHFIPKPYETMTGTEQEELERLSEQYKILQQKYEALNAKFNINQPKPDEAEAAAVQNVLVSQVMGMGKAL